MSAHCDRCGCPLPESPGSAERVEGGRLVCAPCHAALASPPRKNLLAPALAVLLSAGAAGWVGHRLVTLEASLGKLERRTATLQKPLNAQRVLETVAAVLTAAS